MAHRGPSFGWYDRLRCLNFLSEMRASTSVRSAGYTHLLHGDWLTLLDVLGELELFLQLYGIFLRSVF